MPNDKSKHLINTGEALDNLKRVYTDIRTSVANSDSLPEPLYRMRKGVKKERPRSGKRR